MNKTILVLACVLLSVPVLSGCTSSTVSAAPEASMTPVPSVKPVKPVTVEESVKQLKPVVADSIEFFVKNGGSQAVHIVDNGYKTSNVIAVNPAIYQGMVRLSIKDGQVVDPRADENIETQLNILDKILSSESFEGLTVEYRANADKGVISDGKFRYDITVIDNKVSKIVATSLDAANPVKVTYVYSYGDKSYDEAIRIVVDAVNGIFS